MPILKTGMVKIRDSKATGLKTFYQDVAEYRIPESNCSMENEINPLSAQILFVPKDKSASGKDMIALEVMNDDIDYAMALLPDDLPYNLTRHNVLRTLISVEGRDNISQVLSVMGMQAWGRSLVSDNLATQVKNEISLSL